MKLQVILLLIVVAAMPLVWLPALQWRGRVMMAVTFAAYTFFAPVALTLLVGTAVLQWCCWTYTGKGAYKWRSLLTIVIPIVPLVIYKFAFTFNHWLIPLGLSYFAFRQIHVAFEVYKKTIQPPTLSEYLEYLLFLPVILIGPIHRMPDFRRSLRRHKWTPYLISAGLERILYGFVKICFLGNFLCSLWLKGVAADMHSYFPKLYLCVVAFTGNAYFQFAGFSDLAIGAGLLWGVKVMENFNAPFMATNMQAFWQRWHISLSSWCREYVFQPVAGFTRNRWIALVAAMLVLALWHEISVRYVTWGVLQAAFILLSAKCRQWMPRLSVFLNEDAWGKWLARLWVFHLFAFSCVLIGSESIEAVGPLIKKLF